MAHPRSTARSLSAAWRAQGGAAACAAIALFGIACSDAVAPRQAPTATLTVADTTAGLDAPSAYTVLVDGAARGTVTPNGSLDLAGIAPGTHHVTLGGMPANCAFAGDTSAAVSTVAGTAARATLAVSCRPTSLRDRIVFVSTRDSLSKLYAMNPDGSGQVRLTSDTVGEDAPQPSPDGKLVFYQGGYHVEGASSAMRVITTVGSPVAIVHVSYATLDLVGSWTPNGAYVSYNSDVMHLGAAAVVVRTSDWKAVRSISAFDLHGYFNGGIPMAAGWSPDGMSLLVTDNLGWPADVSAVNVASGATTMLTPANDTFEDFDPAWGPTRIAIVRQPWPRPITESGQRRLDSDVYTINPDGSGAVNLTNHPSSYTGPRWSPDGTKITFLSTRGGNTDLWVMNADGTGLTSLTNDAAEETAFTWSPASDRIAFVSNRDGSQQIYAVRVDGTGLVKLTQGPGDNSEPQWSSSPRATYRAPRAAVSAALRARAALRAHWITSHRARTAVASAGGRRLWSRRRGRL